jgi:mannose-1-phosphate guanylyltransferase/mannose-6-phosphate isomerase
MKKTKAKKNVYAVVLAGGVGSRFWPLSRVRTPKQVLKVVGPESLLRATIGRLTPLIPPERVFIVTSSAQAEVIRTHLAYEGKTIKPGYIIEPMGRNTAPAIALAAFALHSKDPEAVMAVLPSDHVIGDPQKFRRTLGAAIKAATEGHLVTFGIVPTGPETAYGYIKASGRAIKRIDGRRVLKVERFVEKPNIKRARGYLKTGGYLWNSGIFVWKAARIIEEIKVHLPAVYKAVEGMRGGRSGAAKAFASMTPVSIDRGVLEKADDVVVIPASFKWSDMGSWTAFADLFPTDRRGNVIKGKVVDIDSSGSIILGGDRVIATIGLKDMIVVDTPDATLVCPKGRAQEVADVVAVLKKKGHGEHYEHLTVKRPWGSYTVLEEGPCYKIKKILVKPGRRLSLQSHKKRSEHWVVISGVARVQRGEETVEISVNQSTYIPRGVRHRLENPGAGPLEIIEVQNGEYVQEDDIERFDDDFKRG